MPYLISNRLSIFTLTIAVSIFILPSVCFSTSLAISGSNPYSSGTIIIKNIGGFIPHYSYDSINFSNNISLSFFVPPYAIPEQETSVGLIMVDSSLELVNSGFKNQSIGYWQKSKLDSTVTCYFNEDTIWSSSNLFPKELMQLESSSHLGIKNGKWLFLSSSISGMPIVSWTGKFENYNNIFYIQSKQNKMKIQIVAIFISIPQGFATKVDSLKILYAVDSLGNGKFTDFTNIKGNNKPSEKSKSSPSFNLRNNNDLKEIQNSGEHFSLYDIRGKQIRIMPRNAGEFPSGVFIYKIDGNKTSALGKIVVR